MRGYESQEREPAADVDHLSRFEAEMKRLKTEREKAIQHADDLVYQVEVLRAKLHEARRTIMSRPSFEGDGPGPAAFRGAGSKGTAAIHQRLPEGRGPGFGGRG